VLTRFSLWGGPFRQSGMQRTKLVHFAGSGCLQVNKSEIFLEIGLNNPLFLPLLQVRPQIKVPGGGEKPVAKCKSLLLIEHPLPAPSAQRRRQLASAG
jgi:hypothetical protein